MTNNFPEFFPLSTCLLMGNLEQGNYWEKLNLDSCDRLENGEMLLIFPVISPF